MAKRNREKGVAATSRPKKRRSGRKSRSRTKNSTCRSRSRRKTTPSPTPDSNPRKRRKVSLMSKRMEDEDGRKAAKDEEPEEARKASPAARSSSRKGSKKDSKSRKKCPELSTFKVSLEKLCKSYSKRFRVDSTKLSKRIAKIFEEENKKGMSRCNSTRAFVIQNLEGQRANYSNFETLNELRSQVSALQKENKQLIKRSKETEDDNQALRKELEEVRKTWFENTGQHCDGNLKKVQVERDGLGAMNDRLREQAKELAAALEKSRKEGQEKVASEVAKIQENHAAIVGKLQVELKTAREQLVAARAKSPLKDPSSANDPRTPQPPAGCAGAPPVLSPNSAQRTELAEQRVDDLIGGKARAAHLSGEHQLTLQRHYLTSARASLQEREDECKRLQHVAELYNVLTGISVKKSDLGFDIRAMDPSQPEHYFDFRLFMKSNSPSLLYEKVCWNSPKQCPAFLDQTGMYFYRSLAPLFMQCMLQPLHEGLGEKALSLRSCCTVENTSQIQQNEQRLPVSENQLA